MPTYTYSCRKCDWTVDHICYVDERDEFLRDRRCPKCHSEIFRECGNAGGFRLDDSGWAKEGYATYYGDAVAFQKK